MENAILLSSESGDWDLRHGDCLDPVTGLASLPDKGVDHVICDPPYSAHVDGNSMRGNGNKAGGKLKALGFDPLTAECRDGVSDQAARVVRRWVLVFSDLESAHLWRESLERAGLEFIRTGIWVKKLATPQFTGDRPAAPAEAITMAHPAGRKTWNGGGKLGAWHFATAYRSGDVIEHTTQKPADLMASLVADFTDPSDLVCDPFAGSGTTGVACRRLGRRFIGWERDEKYAAIARKRIGAAREQLAMFSVGGRK